MNGTWLEEAQQWLVNSGMDLAKNIFIFLIILLVGKIVIGWACSAARTALHRNARISDMLESFAVNVLHKVLWLLVVLVALPRLGVQVGPFIAGLGVTGFILGFAFQDALGNLASGLMILLNEPFRVGDLVETAGVMGVVKELNMMATTLHTPDNKKIVVPNKSVWGGSVTNYTALDTRRVDMTVGISYASDIGRAKEVIAKVLQANELVLDDPAPTIELVAMADSSLNLVVRPWCTTAEYWNVFFSANRGIKEALDQAGIEIPFPQLDVHHHGVPPTT